MMRSRWFLLLAVTLFLLLLGPWLAPLDPAQQHHDSSNTPPDIRYWMGTDDYGRDILSRFLAGAGWSIATGAAATFTVLLLASLIGGTAGFFGGWIDLLAMRLAELFLVLPWFYLLLGLRAVLPLNLPPRAAFAALLLLIALTGWARPARLVRGLVLSLKERGFVHAARGFGVPALTIYLRHIFPSTWDLLTTQALALLPRFVLAEVTLSFLGLGMGEPDPSWGALLVPLKHPWQLNQHWWHLLPAFCMVPFFLVFAVAARHFGRAAAASTLR